MDVTKLGKYDIRARLGRGAMGVVFEGWDPVIARRVAIKTVRLPDSPDDEDVETLARFKREAQAAGRLSHPNIVGVFDYGETDELAYIVMEFIDGRSLKAVLETGEPMIPTEILRIMTALLAGLQYSHDKGVVHRDIKPANIMITNQGQVKIADFGIARIDSSNMTQVGAVMGTPAYMSPEQFIGQAIDGRTDIYSSGVLLYQMLTGKRPFDGTVSGIMHKALNTDPPRPSDLSPATPRTVDALVAKAMARQPEGRFESADAFARALREALEGKAGYPDGDTEATVVARRQSTTATVATNSIAKAPPPRRRGSASPIVAIVALIVVTAAGGALWYQMQRQSPDEPLAAKPSPSRLTNAPPVQQPAPREATSAPIPPPPVSSAPVAPAPATPPETPLVAPSPAAPPQLAARPSTIPDIPSPAGDEPSASGEPPPSPTTAVPATLPTESPLPAAPTTPTGIAADKPEATIATASNTLPLEAAQSLASGVPCSLIDVRGEPTSGDIGRLRLTGVALPGSPFDTFLGQLRGLGHPIDIATERLVPGHCAALAAVADLVRHSRQRSALRMTFPDTPVSVGDKLSVTIQAAGDEALYVDLYTADGAVQHLFRRSIHDSRGGADVSASAIAAGPPGQRLLVAIAGITPLNLAQRPPTENGATYLLALQREMDRVDSDAIRLRAEIALLSFVAKLPQIRQAPVVPASPRIPNLNAARCADIVGRVQLGEALSDADRSVLRTACRP